MIYLPLMSGIPASLSYRTFREHPNILNLYNCLLSLINTIYNVLCIIQDVYGIYIALRKYWVSLKMEARHSKVGVSGSKYIPPSGGRPYSREFSIPDIDRIDLLNEILSELQRQGASKDLLFLVRLAVDEAVINAITHGHGEDIEAPTSPVRVDCLIDERAIAVRVTDNGLGFDPAAVPDPSLDENLWNVTGRGIFLMRQAMDKVDFNSIGNSVLLVRNLADAHCK
jgi:serine/threonine-protein kinase RsbW